MLLRRDRVVVGEVGTAETDLRLPLEVVGLDVLALAHGSEELGRPAPADEKGDQHEGARGESSVLTQRTSRLSPWGGRGTSSWCIATRP